MSDDIDVESARLERLMAQKQKRLTEIIDANKDFAPKAVNVQKTKKNLFPEGYTSEE